MRLLPVLLVLGFGAPVFANGYRVSLRELTGGFADGYLTPTTNWYFIQIELQLSVRRQHCTTASSLCAQPHAWSPDAQWVILGYLGSYRVFTNQTLVETQLQAQRPTVFSVPAATIEAAKARYARRMNVSAGDVIAELYLWAMEARLLMNRLVDVAYTTRFHTREVMSYRGFNAVFEIESR